MKIPRTLVAALTLSAVVATSRPADGQEARTAGDFGAMGTAKVMCSAVFVSGRDLDEAEQRLAATLRAARNSRSPASGVVRVAWSVHQRRR